MTPDWAPSEPRSRIYEIGSNLRLIDGNELVDLILAHYEQLDSSYKGMLPSSGFTFRNSA
jgi:hypothetical protein